MTACTDIIFATFSVETTIPALASFCGASKNKAKAACGYTATGPSTACAVLGLCSTYDAYLAGAAPTDLVA